MADVLARLRSETSAEHHAIERDLHLLDADLPRESYCYLLTRFYGFYKPWEALYYPYLEARLQGLTTGRAKSAWLEQDLRALDTEPANMPLAHISEPESSAQALGAMYVLEGATLGGQIISRALNEDLPRRFFSAYGQETGPMWNRFRHAVVFHVDRNADTAIKSAKQTFKEMHAWLCPKT